MKDEKISLVEHEDFYREGAAIVFTAQYHLRRGYCCGNGCRHCPFSVEASSVASGERLAQEEGLDC
ncbi:MAG TPA: DUF5522 domain-containing protein [Pyrinomonadaceae bacterium]|jgi:2-iminoacetate synthase ThiH